MLNLQTCKKLFINDIEMKELYIDDVRIWKSGPTNLVPLSTEVDGKTIYNGGLGYKNGYRLSSSGAEKAQSEAVTTGFIPAKRGDVIRMKGAIWGTTVKEGYSYIVTYDASRTKLHHANKYAMSGRYNGIDNQVGIDKDKSSIVTDDNGVTTFNLVFTDTKEISYIRISATGDGADMIVTVNEEIEL